MRAQPNRNYTSDSNVATPPALSKALVAYLKPSGHLLEPCSGEGSFVMPLLPYGKVSAIDIAHGHRFEDWTEHVDWVFTNPPWNHFRVFLEKALTVSDHLAFLVTVNHWWTKRRVRAVREAGFGYKDLLLCDWPKEWHSTGFQLGMMHLERGYDGPLNIQHVPWGS